MTRVSQLARELSISSKELMEILKDMGEFVRSPSSTLEAPVVRRVVAQHGGVDRPAQIANPVAVAEKPPHTLPARPFLRRWPQKKYYRGAEPAALAKLILDAVVLPRRGPNGQPGAGYLYFDDEVQLAREIEAEWTEALFEFMSLDLTAEWLRIESPKVSGRQAIVCHQAGMKPRDLETWRHIRYSPTPEQAAILHVARIAPADLMEHVDDRGGPSLAWRLARGQRTVDQVVVEVRRRRGA